MTRLLFGTCFLVGCGIACVSSQRTATRRPSHAGHRVRRPRDTTPGRRTLRAHPPNAAAYSYAAAWYPPGRRISPRWTHIVIHHSATRKGGAKRFDKYHRETNGWDELGYHFVIGNGTDTPDGYVEVGSRWRKQKHGAHCKTPDNYYNEHGIGICLVGDFTQTAPTARQMAALTNLVRFLEHECEIPPERVTAHDAINPRTQCPGSHFRLASFRRKLSAHPTAARSPSGRPDRPIHGRGDAGPDGPWRYAWRKQEPRGRVIPSVLGTVSKS